MPKSGMHNLWDRPTQIYESESLVRGALLPTISRIKNPFVILRLFLLAKLISEISIGLVISLRVF